MSGPQYNTIRTEIWTYYIWNFTVNCSLF